METLQSAYAKVVELLKPSDIIALGPFHYYHELGSEYSNGFFSSFYVYLDEENNHDMTLFRFRNVWNMVGILFLCCTAIGALVKVAAGKPKYGKSFGGWEYKVSLVQDYLYVAIGASTFALLLESVLHALLTFDEKSLTFSSTASEFAGPETVFLVYKLSLLRFAELAVVSIDFALDLYPRSWNRYCESVLSLLFPLAVYRCWMSCAWSFVILPTVFETSRLFMRCIYNAYFKWLHDLASVKKRVTQALIAANVLLLMGMVSATAYYQQQKSADQWSRSEFQAYQLTCLYSIVSGFWWIFKLSGERNGFLFVRRVTGYSLLAALARGVCRLVDPVECSRHRKAERYVKTTPSSKLEKTSSPFSPMAKQKHPTLDKSESAESANAKDPGFNSAEKFALHHSGVQSGRSKITPSIEIPLALASPPSFSPSSRSRFSNMRHRQYTAFTPSSNHHSVDASAMLSEQDIVSLRQRPRSTGFSLFGFNPVAPEKSVASTKIGAFAEMTFETALSVADSTSSPKGKISRWIRSETVQKLKQFAVKKVDEATLYGVQTVNQTVAAINTKDTTFIMPSNPEMAPSTSQVTSHPEPYTAERWSPILDKEKEVYARAA